jgi:hypothetical protein
MECYVCMYVCNSEVSCEVVNEGYCILRNVHSSVTLTGTGNKVSEISDIRNNKSK